MKKNSVTKKEFLFRYKSINYEYVYSSYSDWGNDLTHNAKSDFIYKVDLNDVVETIDTLCAHYNFWSIKAGDGHEIPNIILKELNKLEINKEWFDGDDIVSPEQVLLSFDCIELF